MERKIGLFSRRAFSNAASPHGYQSTGLCACWRRYGLCSPASRFIEIPLLFECRERLRDALPRLGRRGSDRPPADSPGQARKPHRFLDDRRERVHPNRGAERIGERLQPLRLGLTARTDGAVQIRKEPRRHIGEPAHRAHAARAETAHDQALCAREYRELAIRRAGAIREGLLQPPARILDAHEILAARRHAAERLRRQVRAALVREVIRQHRRAHRAADCDVMLGQFVLVVVTPYYLRPTQEELAEHYIAPRGRLRCNARPVLPVWAADSTASPLPARRCRPSAPPAPAVSFRASWRRLRCRTPARARPPPAGRTAA